MFQPAIKKRVYAAMLITEKKILITEKRYIVILIDSLIFLSSFLGVTRMYVNSFFLRTARLWNSLPRECFPLTSNPNVFKSRINRHLLTVGCF